MNKLLYIMFASLFSLDWLQSRVGGIPRVVTWLPELLSIATFVVVAAVVASRRSIQASPKYVLFFFVFFILVVGGLLINAVPAGVVFAGIRNYFKFFPFFLLPLVYRFSDEQIKRQVTFLFVLTLIQIPVAIYQRVFIEGSGDVVGGTLGGNASGTLSVYLLCVMAMSVAFYLKKRVERKTLLILLFVLLIPPALNETKVTFFLLPLAIMIPVVFARDLEDKRKILLKIGSLSAVMFVAFVVAYNYSTPLKSGESIVEWLFAGKGVVKYLSTDRSEREYKIGDDEVKRFDAIRLAAENLRRSGNLLVGVGIGNASPSFSKSTTGEYFIRFERMAPDKVYFSRLLWELGIAGIMLYVVFFALILIDSVSLSFKNDTIGALALGWTAVAIIMPVTFVYQNALHDNIFGYLFWYFSGLIVSNQYQLQMSRWQSVVARYEL